MILDSPFSDFYARRGAVDKGKEHGVHVPRMVTRMAIQMLKGSVEKVAGFSIRDLNPIDYVDRCMLPTLFMCARHDDFVGMHHTKLIYEKYAGPKEIIMVDGDHNSLRNEQALTAAGVFLQRQLKIPPSWAIPYSAQYFACCLAGPSKKNRGARARIYNTYIIARARARVRRRPAVRPTRARPTRLPSARARAPGPSRRAGPTGVGRAREAGAGEGQGRERSAGCSGSAARTAAAAAAAAAARSTRRCSGGSTRRTTTGRGSARGGRQDRRGDPRVPRGDHDHAEYPDAHYNLGIALKNQGRIDEAIREYRKTVKYKPDHADAYNNLGVALEEKGLIEEAVEAYRISIKHNHEHAEAHCNLADALQSIGRLDEAVAEYHIAIAQNLQDADTINNLGTRRGEGQIDGASRRTRPRSRTARRTGTRSATRGRAPPARRLRQGGGGVPPILQNNPKDAQIHSSLGNVLPKGEHAAAPRRTAGGQAQPAGHGHAQQHGHRAATMGNIEEATRAGRAALAQDPTHASRTTNSAPRCSRRTASPRRSARTATRSALRELRGRGHQHGVRAAGAGPLGRGDRGLPQRDPHASRLRERALEPREGSGAAEKRGSKPTPRRRARWAASPTTAHRANAAHRAQELQRALLAKCVRAPEARRAPHRAHTRFPRAEPSRRARGHEMVIARCARHLWSMFAGVVKSRGASRSLIGTR